MLLKQCRHLELSRNFRNLPLGWASLLFFFMLITLKVILMGSTGLEKFACSI